MRTDDEGTYDLDTEEGMANAKRWTEQLLARLSPQAKWLVPRSLSIFELNKTTRTARQLCGGPEPAIRRVFEALGWTVTVVDDEEDV